MCTTSNSTTEINGRMPPLNTWKWNMHWKNNMRGKSWFDDGVPGVSSLLLIHADSTNGFVPSFVASFRWSQISGNFHVTINSKNYTLALRK